MPTLLVKTLNQGRLSPSSMKYVDGSIEILCLSTSCIFIPSSNGEPLETNSKFCSPLLEGIKIHEVDKHKISIDPSTYFIEDGDKRPWFNVFTNSVGIISIYAKAIASVSRDDNDL